MPQDQNTEITITREGVEDTIVHNQNTKVLVTGATGYVGSHVTKYLTQKGYKTVGIDRNIAQRKYITDQLPETTFYEAMHGDDYSVCGYMCAKEHIDIEGYRMGSDRTDFGVIQ